MLQFPSLYNSNWNWKKKSEFKFSKLIHIIQLDLTTQLYSFKISLTQGTANLMWLPVTKCKIKTNAGPFHLKMNFTHNYKKRNCISTKKQKTKKQGHRKHYVHPGREMCHTKKERKERMKGRKEGGREGGKAEVCVPAGSQRNELVTLYMKHEGF